MFGFGKKPVERLDFIIAGAQKSGTTALNYYLKRHRRIALPRKKELHFFDNDKLFETGQPDYERLHRMFRPARPGSIAGENTPIYLYWKPALPRIREYNAAIKLIVILRNPVERAFSQWNMQRVRGAEPLDFIEAVQEETRRIAEAAPKQLRKFSYVDRGYYAEQLDRAFQIFPPQQFLILKYEQFRAQQRASVESVFSFLDLSPPRFRQIEAHSIPYMRVMRPEERKLVFDLLAKDIVRLERMLGWDCYDWR